LNSNLLAHKSEGKNMITRRRFNFKFGSAALGLAPSLSLMRSAAAANYPAGPVKLIVAQGAGGAVDILSRVVADHLGHSWNSQVVVLSF
jgi:tripartite-type tricarboxylate transporter receptor subunit TctC